MCLFVYSASNVHCTPIICQNTKPMKANNQYKYLKINSNRDMVSATSTSTCKLIVIVSFLGRIVVALLCFWYLEFGIWYAREISQCGEWILVAVHQFREIFYGFELQVSLENSTAPWFSVFHIYCLYFSLHAISQTQLLIKLQIAET